MSGSQSAAARARGAMLVEFTTREAGVLAFRAGNSVVGQVRLGDRLGSVEGESGADKSLRSGTVALKNEHSGECAEREVVVKSVKPGTEGRTGSTARRPARFSPLSDNEFARLAEVSKDPHPNLLGALVLGVDEAGTRHIVMAKGVSDFLEAILRDHRAVRQMYPAGACTVADAFFRARETAVRPTLRAIFSGVAELHKRGLAHLDIAGENVLLLDGGRVAVIDFEHTQRLGEVVVHRTETGRAYLWSPELQAARAPTRVDGAKVDAWACAMLAFMAVTTEPAWMSTASGDARFACFRRGAAEGRGFGIRSFLRHCDLQHCLSPSLTDLLDRMTCVDPERRLSVADALGHAWFAPDRPALRPAARRPVRRAATE